MKLSKLHHLEIPEVVATDKKTFARTGWLEFDAQNRVTGKNQYLVVSKGLAQGLGTSGFSGLGPKPQ